MPIVELALTPSRPQQRDLLCGAPPTDAELAAARAAGVRSVLDLRPVAEGSAAADAARAAAGGLAVQRVEVAGAAGLTRENVVAFAAILDAPARAPLLLHCATGNRVGALTALKAAWLDGMPPQAALELGFRAGLTKLEPAVRAALKLG
jgi:protein tyrosine phosphatase (PTP) superfamily phosphohydrolase (DUF442 family)